MRRKYTKNKPPKYSRALTDRTDWRTPFLAALARTANISEACRVALIDRQTYCNWLKRQDPKGKAFQAGVQEALEQARDVLRREIWRRAVEGVERKKFTSRGEVIKDPETQKQYVEREYSETLMAKLATAHLPEFKDVTRHEHTGKDGAPIESKVTTELSLDSLLADPESARLVGDLARRMALKPGGNGPSAN